VDAEGGVRVCAAISAPSAWWADGTAPTAADAATTATAALATTATFAVAVAAGGGRGQTGRDASRACSGAARAADRGGRRGCSVGRETRDKAGDRVGDVRAGDEGERPGDVRGPHEAIVRLPAGAAGAEMRDVCASQIFRRLEQPAPDLAARIGCRVMGAQERQPRTSEERLDRRRRRLEHVGDLVLRQTAPVAKDEGMMLGLGKRPEHPADLGELRCLVAGGLV